MVEIILGSKPNQLDTEIFRSQHGRDPQLVDADGCGPFFLTLVGMKPKMYEVPGVAVGGYQIDFDDRSIRPKNGAKIKLTEEAWKILEEELRVNYIEDNMS